MANMEFKKVSINLTAEDQHHIEIIKRYLGCDMTTAVRFAIRRLSLKLVQTEAQLVLEKQRARERGEIEV